MLFQNLKLEVEGGSVESGMTLYDDASATLRAQFAAARSVPNIARIVS